MKTLITGAAGFIGYHLSERLASGAQEIVAIDNLNDYYDVKLKHDRLRQLGIDVSAIDATQGVVSDKYPNLVYYKADIADDASLRSIFSQEGVTRVYHLAAQAGVRHSLSHPHVYVKNNITGFLNLLEQSRDHAIQHIVYASSSSVYGIDKQMPFVETTAADHPASLYAVSKRCNELMAHSYSHLYGLPTTGLRFFSVYGPWGRPDMALFLFAKAILDGEPISLYNDGKMQRDFTYIDDIVDGLVQVIDNVPLEGRYWDGRQSSVSPAPYQVYNVGRGQLVDLLDFVDALERELGRKAVRHYLPMQPGDVASTWSDCGKLSAATGYHPTTSVGDGIRRFVEWYRAYYDIT